MAYPRSDDNLVPVPVNVTAIQIDAGRVGPHHHQQQRHSRRAYRHRRAWAASPAAIIDRSGTLQTVNNTGSIEALLNQTVTTTPLPPPTPAIQQHRRHRHERRILARRRSTSSPRPPTLATVSPYAATSSYTVGEIVSYQGNIYVNVVAAGPASIRSTIQASGARSARQPPRSVRRHLHGFRERHPECAGRAVTSATISMGGGVNTITVAGIVDQPGGGGRRDHRTGGRSFVISVNNGTLADTNPALNQNANRSMSAPPAC